LARPEGTNIVKKSEQVEKLLGGVRSAQMVHAMEISPQAPKDMLSSIGGFGDRCGVGKGQPMRSIRLGAIKGLLGLLQQQTTKKAQQPRTMALKESSHFTNVRIRRVFAQAHQALECPNGVLALTSMGFFA
jgi:hypothetical protein